MLSHLGDILARQDSPECCDVMLVGTDGEIPGNKTILSMLSSYFHHMFSEDNVESQPVRVELPYTKAALEKIVINLYIGELECQGMTLSDLLSLLSGLFDMDLHSDFSAVDFFTTKNIKSGKFSLADCVKSLDKYSRDDCSPLPLGTVWDSLITHLGENIQLVEDIGILSEPMIIRLINEGKGVKSQAIHRVKAFIAWLSVNKMEEKIKEEVIRTFDIKDFSHEELASDDIRKAGFFSTDQIIDRMEDIHQDKDQELKEMIEAKDQELKEMLEQKERWKRAHDRVKDDMRKVKLRFDRTRSTEKIDIWAGPRVNLWEEYAPDDVKDKY